MTVPCRLSCARAVAGTLLRLATALGGAAEGGGDYDARTLATALLLLCADDDGKRRLHLILWRPGLQTA